MRRIIYLFSVFFISISQSFGNQEDVSILQKADSLFKNKQYVQAFDNYTNLLENQSNVSQTMLLKMAFISEGLENYAEALYYLNLYYTIAPSEAVLDKMASLADKHKLTGYDISDSILFKNFLYEYSERIGLYTFGSIFLFVMLLFWMKKKQKNRAIKFSSSLCLVLLFMLLVEINWLNKVDYGIIVHHEGYLMSAPSSGSKVLEIIPKGSRMNLSYKKDVWFKVNNPEYKEAYIRDSNVKTLSY